MRFCRRCGQVFFPRKPSETLCQACDPVVVPFPVPPPDLIEDVREGWGG